MKNIQYISDCNLIDKLFLIDAGINYSLYKKAGLADSFLGSMTSGIMDWAKQHIDTSSLKSVMTSLADLLIPGVLFKVHPLLGALATVGEILGFSPTSIVKKMVSFVSSAFKAGKLPTLDEVNNVGKQAVATEAGPLVSENSNDMFGYIRKYEKDDSLVKLAAKPQSFMDYMSGYNPSRSDQSIPFFGAGKEHGIIERIFGNLFKLPNKGKAKWLFGGFVVWIVKTILLGAGLIYAGEKVKSLLSPGEQQTKQPAAAAAEQQKTQEEIQPTAKEPAKENKPATYQKTTSLIPSGKGTDNHTNDHSSSTWIVPLINNSVENTLLMWADDIYKNFDNNYIDTNSFHNLVYELKKGMTSGSGKLTIPSKYKSRKQIVDQFVGE